jgi:hypothetical protein
MLALLSKFVCWLRLDGVRAPKLIDPESLDPITRWKLRASAQEIDRFEREVVCGVNEDGGRVDRPQRVTETVLLSCGHRIQFTHHAVQRCFCEACLATELQSANAGDAQPTSTVGGSANKKGE